METEEALKDKFIDLLPYSSNMNLIAEKCVNICKEHNNKLKQEHAEMLDMLVVILDSINSNDQIEYYSETHLKIELLLNKIKENGN